MDSETSMLKLLQKILLDETADPTDLPLSLLKSMTNDFSDDLQIGYGGFAVVYKGFVGNAETLVAVKKLSNKIDMDDAKYNHEVGCLMKLRHKNIIRFLGYCANRHGKMWNYDGNLVMADVHHKLLCFEYMRKGSLHEHIEGASCGLDWAKRYQIIKGICEGLRYLHEQRVVHLDLKPANILLDDNMVPKISDFGLSRCFDEEQSHAIMTTLCGSSGYLAPEFWSRVITFKLDIYSLGVIFTEILTGEKGYSAVNNVLESWMKRFGTSSTDRLLEQVKVCAQISIDCMDVDPKKRPDIQKIILQLDETERTGEFIESGTNVPPGNPHKEILDDRPISSCNVVEVPERKLSDTTYAVVRGGKTPYTSEWKVWDQKLHDPTEPPIFLSFEFLKDITCDFSADLELGRGGYGVVYKGVLPSGTIIAVKKIFDVHTVEDDPFQQQVSNLMAIKHKNIVRLLGYCAESRWEAMRLPSGTHVMVQIPRRLLCFEYLCNNSLEKYISDESCGLDWNTRYEIIKGICSGLHYLHWECDIMHLGLKPKNILLDGTMMPKISDFGLWRLLGGEKLQYNICGNIAGSLGYMAPEYLMKGILSHKADIFSFGSIIIEIITGSKHYPMIEYQLDQLPSTDKIITGEMDDRMRDDMSQQLFIDDVLGRWTNTFQSESKYSSPEMRTQQVKQCMTVALKCLDPDMKKRPNARDIMEMLGAVETSKMDPGDLRNSPVDQVDMLQLPDIQRKDESSELNIGGNKELSFASTTREMFDNKVASEVVDKLKSMIIYEAKSEVTKEIAGGVCAAREPQRANITKDPENHATEIIQPGYHIRTTNIAMHPTKTWIITTYDNGSFRIWDYHTQEAVKPSEFLALEGVSAAVFIERMEWFVTGDYEGYIKVYCYSTMRQRKVLKAHESVVTSLDIHPTEPYVLSAAQDNHVKLWDWKKDWACVRAFEARL